MSMGSATVLMASGLRLPLQVKGLSLTVGLHRRGRFYFCTESYVSYAGVSDPSDIDRLVKNAPDMGWQNVILLKR